MQSNRTPLGLHRVARKVGGGQPVGTVFKSRQPVGLTWQGQPEGGIVHRILWLEGLEPENANTFSRYSYIHGTNAESDLGVPASEGCVRMRNLDVADLFDCVDVGTEVVIDAGEPA